MAIVIGVRFKKATKVYYFDPGEYKPEPGDHVVVETARGDELGEVVAGARTISDAQVVAPLKKVVRIATPADIERARNNEKRESDAMRICNEKILKHKLDMKLVSVEYTFDNSKLIFYFTSNGRVDFRDLVKDLASVFKMRIELRQIGVRDEAKMLGGIGSCGRPICCHQFLPDFQPVSIKMAKEQNLSLNPTKISGLCGRLMCCLKYEQDNYDLVLKRLPKIGKDIVTPDGVGVITEINAIRETVRVRIRTAEDNFDMRDYPIDDVRRLGPGDEPAARETPKPRKPVPAAEPIEENTEDKLQKKRIPHQKVTKTLSTDQFLEQINDTPVENGETPADKSERRPRRRPDRPERPERREENGAPQTKEPKPHREPRPPRPPREPHENHEPREKRERGENAPYRDRPPRKRREGKPNAENRPAEKPQQSETHD